MLSKKSNKIIKEIDLLVNEFMLNVQQKIIRIWNKWNFKQYFPYQMGTKARPSREITNRPDAHDARTGNGLSLKNVCCRSEKATEGTGQVV